MAYIKLAVSEHNLGNFARRDKSAAQALKLADRLTPGDRAYIEGFLLRESASTARQNRSRPTSVAWTTDPATQACRNNLAIGYYDLRAN